MVASSGNNINATNCTFTGGRGQYGGAVRAGSNTTATFTSCVFSGNSATDPDGGTAAGGGVFHIANPGAVINLDHCILTSNYGIHRGGGMIVQATAIANLTECIITGNTATYGNTIMLQGVGNTVNIHGGTYGYGIHWDSDGNTITLGGLCSLYGIADPSEFGTHPLSIVVSSGAVITLTNSITPQGTGNITVLTGGCTVNGAVIPAGTYTQIVSSGGSAVAS